MVNAEAESFGLQRTFKSYWKSGAQNMQKLKVHPSRRREKYGNRFLMSLKLPAGRRIYHKSSRSPWNNLKNESPTWSTNIVKSGQEWTVLEKKALRKLWEPSNFFTLWMKSSDRSMGLICFDDHRVNCNNSKWGLSGQCGNGRWSWPESRGWIRNTIRWKLFHFRVENATCFIGGICPGESW